MKKVKILYKDSPTYSGSSDYEFTTREYDPDVARTVADNLAKMGCHSFKFIPAQEAA